MNRSSLLVSTALQVLTLASAGTTQYLNRAVYLGRDAEDMRRDYEQNAEYLLSRFSYLQAPWWREDLDPFRDEIVYSVGSTTSRDFTIEGKVQIRKELGEDFTVQFHLLQSEHQDAQFLRNALEIEYAAGKTWSPFVMLEGTTEKQEGDLSLGVYLRDPGSEEVPGSYQLRLMFTAVDVVSAKSEVTEYETKPYGLMLSGFLGTPGRAQLGMELATQLPAELVELDLGRSFEIERHIGSVETRIPLNDRNWFVSEIEAEYSKRERTPFASTSPDLERSRRDYLSFRAEWWRRSTGGGEFSAGVMIFWTNEDGYRPNQPSETLRIEREEYYAIARGLLVLDERWAIEPNIFAGYGEFDELLGNTQQGKFRGFQGKAGAGLRYRFSEDAWVMLNLTAEIDRATFSGANIQFKSSF